MAGKGALTEVTLAIARVVAAHDPGFAEALGTELRRTLKRISFKDRAFDEMMHWLERFERPRDVSESEANHVHGHDSPTT